MRSAISASPALLTGASNIADETERNPFDKKGLPA